MRGVHKCRICRTSTVVQPQQCPTCLANSPGGLALADFDGNGTLDLAVALRNLNPQGIKVALGNGDGTYQPFDFYSIPGSPHDVAVGDFDGDFNLDLAVPNSGSVSILLGNGDGSFGSPVAFGSSAISREIVVGDFNGDSKLDVAVTNELNNPGTITVLLGNGDGTLASPNDYAAGAAPHNLVAADFNADGELDVAVVNNTNLGTLSILEGRGDGTFHPPLAHSVGPRPASIAAGDLNGDVYPDLVIGNHSGGTVSVLLGNGNGSFLPSIFYAVGLFSGSSFINWNARSDRGF